MPSIERSRPFPPGFRLGWLGDRCVHWVTINEPNAVAVLSRVTAAFPPGRLLAFGDLVRASAATMRAVDEGVPVNAYFHWTLADNYEWGSYDPRFGHYSVDRRDGRPEWHALDSMGDDAAGTFRRLGEGLRAGDRSVLG